MISLAGNEYIQTAGKKGNRDCQEYDFRVTNWNFYTSRSDVRATATGGWLKVIIV